MNGAIVDPFWNSQLLGSAFQELFFAKAIVEAPLQPQYDR